MILATAAVLTAVGFGAWILGSIFEYTEVAVLGATIVVGVGAMVLTTGLEIRDGEVREKTFANETGPGGNQTLVNNETDVDYQYTTFAPMREFQLGALWMLLGVMLVLRPLNDL